MKNKIREMMLMKKPVSMICDVIAKHLMGRYIFKTVSGKKTNSIFVYYEGVFMEKGKDVIERECEDILEEASRTHTIKEIREKIERLTKVDRREMGCKDRDLVCLRNGVLNLKTKELIPHSKDYRFMSKIPVDYIPEAYCTNIFEFLNDILIYEDIDCIQEWFGYQLYREYFIKKASIFRGLPDTGKTTFMNLLKAFVGEDNCCSISLQLLAQGKWQILPLYNKHSNICDDLSEADITDSGTFKQITGRSPIRAEEKFGDAFDFENYAKMSFACNKVPAIRSDVDDQAYWDRWLIFDFVNVFDRVNKSTDNKIIHKITTKEELSGLLNWALEGLERLQERGYFDYRRNWEENKRIMLGEASSVARFVNDALINITEEWVSNAELFEMYEEYCILNDITIVENQIKFGRDVKTYCKYGQFGINRDGKYGVRNVKIRSPLPIFGV